PRLLRAWARSGAAAPGQPDRREPPPRRRATDANDTYETFLNNCSQLAQPLQANAQAMDARANLTAPGEKWTRTASYRGGARGCATRRVQEETGSAQAGAT